MACVCTCIAEGTENVGESRVARDAPSLFVGQNADEGGSGVPPLRKNDFGNTPLSFYFGLISNVRVCDSQPTLGISA